MKLKKWLQENATGEVQKHTRRRAFPKTEKWRDFKLYFNTKYKGQYISQSVIDVFEKAWDEYWQLKEGDNNK